MPATRTDKSTGPDLNCHAPLGCYRFRGRTFGFVFGPVLASWRSASAFDSRHPGWWASAAATTTASQTLEGHDCFFYLLALRAQLGQHLVYIHLGSPQDFTSKISLSVLKSEQDSKKKLSCNKGCTPFSRCFQALCSENRTERFWYRQSCTSKPTGIARKGYALGESRSGAAPVEIER